MMPAGYGLRSEGILGKTLNSAIFGIEARNQTRLAEGDQISSHGSQYPEGKGIHEVSRVGQSK